VGKVCEPGMYTGLEEDETQWFNWTLLLPRLVIQFNSVQFNSMLYLKPGRCTLFMKQQFVITHQYTVSWETENTCPILHRSTHMYVMFLEKYKEMQFF
jgi:hypothetical protein